MTNSTNVAMKLQPGASGVEIEYHDYEATLDDAIGSPLKNLLNAIRQFVFVFVFKAEDKPTVRTLSQIVNAVHEAQKAQRNPDLKKGSSSQDILVINNNIVNLRQDFPKLFVEYKKVPPPENLNLILVAYRHEFYEETAQLIKALKEQPTDMQELQINEVIAALKAGEEWAKEFTMIEAQTRKHRRSLSSLLQNTPQPV